MVVDKHKYRLVGPCRFSYLHWADKPCTGSAEDHVMGIDVPTCDQTEEICGLAKEEKTDPDCTRMPVVALDLRTPGAKADQAKLRYDLLPPGAIAELVEVLSYGARKYSPDGWRKVPDGKARYTAALMRHFELWRAGERLDSESGLRHLSHVLCNAIFLLEMELGNLTIEGLPK